MVKIMWILVVLVLGVSSANSASSSNEPKEALKKYDWQLLKTLIALIANIQKPKTDISKTQKTIQQATTMGILMGTIKTEEKMEKNLLGLILELFQTYQKINNKEIGNKIKVIEATMERDKRAIQILNNALNLAMKSKTLDEYRKELNKIALENSHSKNAGQINSKLKMETKDKLMKGFKLDVIKHMTFLRKSVGDSTEKTMKNIEKDKKEVLPVRAVQIVPKPLLIPTLEEQFIPILNENHLQEISIPIQYWPFSQFDLESFQRFRRQNDDKSENQVTVDIEKENEDDLDFEDNPVSGNGGFAGLIASLSGGDEGSDVGALVGALSGLISNLFGPGGLDVPSLLSTGTSLIAGLLGGDENFGKVLGEYIGIGVEGFSGGGADNNGAFFGNFLGSLLASLSSDPEDDDNPPQPKLFIENFFKGLQGKQKRGADGQPAEGGDHHKGSGHIFEFINNIISSLFGGITSIILNASFGSSGGSSQGSGDLSAGSSAASANSSGSKHPSTKEQLNF
ncbi:unnamed protein product [Diamesa serratosioi]